jgi:hypothetical protein
MAGILLKIQDVVNASKALNFAEPGSAKHAAGGFAGRNSCEAL